MFFETLKKWLSKNNLNDIELASVNLKKINPSKFNKVFSSDYSIIPLRAYWSTAVQYTIALKYINKCLADCDSINVNNISFASSEVLLLQFYFIKSKYYNPIQTTEEFIAEAIKFLNIFNKINKKIIKEFNDERNIRLTEHLVKDILNISKELQRVR